VLLVGRRRAEAARPTSTADPALTPSLTSDAAAPAPTADRPPVAEPDAEVADRRRPSIATAQATL